MGVVVDPSIDGLLLTGVPLEWADSAGFKGTYRTRGPGTLRFRWKTEVVSNLLHRSVGEGEEVHLQKVRRVRDRRPAGALTRPETPENETPCTEPA